MAIKTSIKLTSASRKNYQIGYSNIKNLSIIFISFSIFVVSACSTSNNQINNENGFDNLIKRSIEGINTIDTAKLKKKTVNLVIKGSSLQQQGKYAEAILEFQETLRLDTSYSIYYALAYNYKELNKYELALENIIKSYELKNDFIPTLELLAEIYLYLYRIDDAIVTYEKIEAIKPTKGVQMRIARLYENRKRDKAIEIYENLLQTGEDYYILLRLSGLYELKNDTLKYIQTLEKMLDYKQTNTEAIIALMDAYHKYKQLDKALEMLEKITNQLPQDVTENLYEFYTRELVLDTSEILMNQIPKILDRIGPNFYYNWKIQLNMGLLYERIKDTVKAEKKLIHTINISDSIADIPIQLGFFYFRVKKNEEAFKTFTEYEDKFPTDARYPFYKSVALTNLQRFEESLLPLLRAIDLDSGNVDYWIQLGILYDRLNKHDSSDYAYEKALMIDPDEPLANNNYAYSLSIRGKNLEDALIMSEKALKAEPDNPSYLDTYGWIHFKLGNIQIAIEKIKKAIEIGEVTTEVYEHLGDIYNTLGDKNEARKQWQKGLELEPDNKNLLERLNKED